MVNKKKLAAFAACAFGAVSLLGIAQADVFNPTDGTVTVMASGGTVHVETVVGPVSTSGGATVATLTVPPGRYEVSAVLWMDEDSSSSNFIQCGLVNVDETENSRSTLSANGYEALSELGTLDAASETDIEVFCNSSAAATANYVVVHATTVSAID